MNSVAELVKGLRLEGTSLTLDDGASLCLEGDDSDAAFIVETGELAALIDLDGVETLVGRHGPGALVGEITTVVGGVRTATLRAVGPTTVVVLTQATLARWLDDHPDVARSVLDTARERTDRNRASTLLAEHLGIDDAELAVNIAGRLSIERHRLGEVLFEAGDVADRAGVILSGRTALSASDTPRREARRGDLIGYEGLFGERRTRNAIAVRDTTIGWLSRPDFAQLTEQNPLGMVDIVRRVAAERSVTGSELGQSIALITVVGHRDFSVARVLREGLAEQASVMHLTPARVDELLGTDSVAMTTPGRAGHRRVEELLHQVEVEHDVVLLEAKTTDGPWFDRVVRHADHVIVWSEGSLTADVRREIERLVASVGDGSPVWLALEHAPGIDLPRDTPALREQLGVSEVHHVRDGSVADRQRIGRLAAGLGTALVLSGGGARGFAHLGAYRSLMEHGVAVDRVAGASMGSVIAAGIALGLTDESLLSLVEKQFKGLLDYTVPLVSVLKGERIAANITETFGGADVEDLWIPFSCVTTNLTKNRVQIHRTGALDHAVRASVAIPGILPPVPHGDDLLIDGGVLDNLPLELATEDPSIGTVIAVDVAPPTGPRAKVDFGFSVSGWSALRDRLRRGNNQLPSLSSVLMRTMTVGSAQVRDRRLESGDADLYLYLDLAGVGLLDFENVRPIADRGYEAADPAIGEWLALPGTEATSGVN